MNRTLQASLRLNAIRPGGFTLIDVLVTLAIIAILSAIAIPSYGNYVLRAARAEARATLLESSQFMERFYAVNNRYDQRLDGAAVTLPVALTQSPRSGTPRYTISLVAAALTRGAYTLRAVPSGASATDQCGTLTLTSTGVRGSSTMSTPAGVAECWR